MSIVRALHNMQTEMMNLGYCYNMTMRVSRNTYISLVDELRSYPERGTVSRDTAFVTVPAPGGSTIRVEQAAGLTVPPPGPTAEAVESRRQVYLEKLKDLRTAVAKQVKLASFGHQAEVAATEMVEAHFEEYRYNVLGT